MPSFKTFTAVALAVLAGSVLPAGLGAQVSSDPNSVRPAMQAPLSSDPKSTNVDPKSVQARLSSDPNSEPGGGLPAVIVACWVPASGTVYRVDPLGQTPGMPKACLSATHKQFEWNQQGIKGDAGAKGDVGPKGDTGPQGEAGPKGDPGPAGTAALPLFKTNFYDLSGPTGPASGFVAFGAVGQGSDELPSGFGTRLMWYPRKQAFRAGGVNSTQWDEANIGQSSFAGGGDTEASGVASTAFGARSVASGFGSTAFGNHAVATAEGATAGGVGAVASSTGATAFGDRANASATFALAVGFRSLASSRSSTAIGEDARATGFGAVSIGLGNLATGVGSLALGGGTTATGDYSVAMGRSTFASGQNSVAIGTSLSTAGKHGAMVLGDRDGTQIAANADNQLTGRFSGGYRLLTNGSGDTEGCSISSSARLSCTGGVGSLSITRSTSVVYTVPGNRSRREFQSCPAGTQVVGGGVSTEPSFDMKIRQSYPDFENNRWYAEARNDYIEEGYMKIFVICTPQ